MKGYPYKDQPTTFLFLASFAGFMLVGMSIIASLFGATVEAVVFLILGLAAWVGRFVLGAMLREDARRQEEEGES